MECRRWRCLYARRLASGVRARLWVIAEAIADLRMPIFLGSTELYVVFTKLASFLVCYQTLASLTARSAFQRPYGSIIARLTRRKADARRIAAIKRLRRAPRRRVRRRRAWAISLKSDKNSPVPPSQTRLRWATGR